MMARFRATAEGNIPFTEEEELERDLEEAQARAAIEDYEKSEYQRLRVAEYPDFKDYLDGIVKGDQEQIQQYINACLAVKEKYPKPV